MLGKFICEWQGKRIEVGPGVLKHDQLEYIWNHKEELLDKYLKFRYFGHGIKDLPRMPRTVGFRDEWDFKAI